MFFLITIFLIVLSSFFAILFRIEGRRERSRKKEGILCADDFKIIE